MDLSFARFELDGTAIALPGDLAVLMAGVSIRQATSQTAMIETCGTAPVTADGWLCPPHGAFNRTMAATICAWKQE